MNAGDVDCGGATTLLLFLPVTLLAAPAELQVTQAGPMGEIAKLEEAKEIRVVFSEPMVALGRNPETVTAPFFSLKPQIPGRLRWSGTNTLIFTPEGPGKLPYATRYDVTVGEGATSVAGRRLARPYTFSFTTPTVRLLRTGWYRRGKRHDAPVVIALRFNQPVSREGVVPHLRFDLVPHEFVAPVLPPEGLDRLKALDSKAIEDFEAKVARAGQAASSRDAVPVSGTAAAEDGWSSRGPRGTGPGRVSTGYLTPRPSPTLRARSVRPPDRPPPPVRLSAS